MGRAQWAFLGGLVNGGLNEYYRQRQLERQERQDDRLATYQAAQIARQKRLDAQAEESHSINMQNARRAQSKMDNEDAIERAYAEAFEAGVPQPANVVDGGVANNAVVKDKGNADIVADFAANPGTPEAQAASTAQAGEQSAPAPQVKPAAVIPQLDGTQKLYTGLNSAAEAQKFAQENPTSSVSRFKALHAKIAAMPGGAKYADQIMAKIKEAQSEGAFQALNLAQAGRTEEAMQLFNRDGLIKIGEGDYLTHDPIKKSSITGKPLVRLLSKDGKPVVEDAEAALFGFMFSPAAAYKMEMDAHQSRLKAREKAEVAAQARKDRLEDRKEMLLFSNSLKAPAGSSGGRGGRGAAGESQDGGLPSPLEGFDDKAQWRAAVELAQKRAEAVSAANPAAAWSDDKVVQEANRLYRVARDDFSSVGRQEITRAAFKNSAAKASTPQQVEAVKKQAAALGMTEEEIIAEGGEKFAPAYPKVPAASDAVGNLAVKQYGANTWANRQRAYQYLQATLSK